MDPKAPSPKSELIARLSEVAREAMPALEFRKFERSILRGRGPVRLPRDLPPITIYAPKRKRSRKRQPIARPECGWYYGEKCGCGGSTRLGHPYARPKQLALL